MSPEREVKLAVQMELERANLRFDRARLDLLRPDGAPHSLDDVREWQAELTAQALREGFAAVGRGLGAMMRTLGSVARAFNGGVAEGSRDGYVLAGPAEGSAGHA